MSPFHHKQPRIITIWHFFCLGWQFRGHHAAAITVMGVITMECVIDHAAAVTVMGFITTECVIAYAGTVTVMGVITTECVIDHAGTGT